MDSESLEPWQLERLREMLLPGMRTVAAIRERMFKCVFPRQDPLFLLIDGLYTDLRKLSMELHYQSCNGGVGDSKRAGQGYNDGGGSEK